LGLAKQKNFKWTIKIHLATAKCSKEIGPVLAAELPSPNCLFSQTVNGHFTAETAIAKKETTIADLLAADNVKCTREIGHVRSATHRLLNCHFNQTTNRHSFAEIAIGSKKMDNYL
jgi:hypothetical protein